jgi:translation initiation factor IF-2
MSDGNERNETPPSGRKPLTLTPRTQSAGTVKQSFSHGRSKQVDVVIRGPRRATPPGAPAAPAAPAQAAPPPPAAPAARSAPAPSRPAPAGEPGRRQQSPSSPRPSSSGPAGPRLSDDEQKRRQAAVAQAVVDQERRQKVRAEEEERERARAEEERILREQEERERAAREAEARKANEEEARRRAAEVGPAPAPEAAIEMDAPPPAPADRPAGPRLGAPGPIISKLAAAPDRQPVERSSSGAGQGQAQGQAQQGQQGQPPERRALSLADIARVKQPAKTAAPAVRPAKPKGEAKRREGRLTLDMVERMTEGDDEKVRSLAAMRRARERERERRVREMRGGDQHRIVRDVIIPETITVQDLALRMSSRVADVIKYLMRQGTMATMNTILDADTAELIATDLGHNVKRVSAADVEEGLAGPADAPDDERPRPPVVTVMGHVDHGKTSLLDALRSADVAAGEAGGITQHIGAYQVRLQSGERVTFLDTPGHAAFSSMRARGAQVTDIVVLVVAADDGVMPQTVEAISHAKAANVPIIVAINKIDKPDATPQRVINELLQHEIVTEVNGGDVQAVSVSAIKRTGLDQLVEAILLQAELLDLRANPERAAEAVVIESRLDRGRGPVATVLVHRGTLKRGDIVIAGASWGRVRALLNERGQQVTEAGPSEPVEIMGLEGVPDPGEPLVVVETETRAREVSEYRQRLKREKSAAGSGQRATLEQMMTKIKDSEVKELPVVVKTDVQGSAEAIANAIEKLGTEEVRGKVLQATVGAINEADVTLAKASGAPVIGFNVRASKEARDLAEREGVEIRYYAIIYDLIDDLKGVLSGMLAPIERETFLGTAVVLETFQITKVGRVAGCRVNEGKMQRGARIRLLRDNVVIHEGGKLNTLKRFKDDVNDVAVGQECGMSFENYQDIKPGDVVECYLLESIQRSL